MPAPVRYVTPLLSSPPAILTMIQEYSLEKAMQKMVDDWEPIVFNTTLYRDTGKTFYHIWRFLNEDFIFRSVHFDLSG